MSGPYTTGKLIARFLLYALLALLGVMAVQTYRIVRKERVATRFSVQLTDGQHEIVASLPSGHFQIQFTSKPTVSPSVIVSPEAVLPARITTTIQRQDGSVIVEPTQKEYLTFAVASADAYRPLRLSVGITSTNECKVYMNMASGF